METYAVDKFVPEPKSLRKDSHIVKLDQKWAEGSQWESPGLTDLLVTFY